MAAGLVNWGSKNHNNNQSGPAMGLAKACLQICYAEIDITRGIYLLKKMYFCFFNEISLPNWHWNVLVLEFPKSSSAPPENF